MITYYPDIGTAIIEKRQKEKIRLLSNRRYYSSFLVEVADSLGKSPNVTYDKIRLIERGDIYGTTSIKGVKWNIDTHLHELSIYLQALGYDEADPLIEQIREVDYRFVYPPQ